jgi:DNA modification methylase
MINKMYNEDNLLTMGRMNDNFIDLTVTSPPYDNLRTYNGFPVYDLGRHRKTARELFRVTKPGGIVVWVVADATIDGSKTGTSFRQALVLKKAGFRLYDNIIWDKKVFSMPQRNRYHQVYEYMFVFSKGTPKTVNLIMDRENKSANQAFGKQTKRTETGEMETIKKNNYNNKYGRRYNIWSLGTVAHENICKKLDHPAAFPKKLAKDHIVSWSNEGDIVYDPFCGSGTTIKVAKELGRNWIGSEISKDYINIE